MKTTLPPQTKRKADSDWVKTPCPNLLRYQPSGNYFGRVRVNGKLIRRSLDTHVLTLAKLKLSDFLQDHRRLAVNKGQSSRARSLSACSDRKRYAEPETNLPFVTGIEIKPVAGKQDC